MIATKIIHKGMKSIVVMVFKSFGKNKSISDGYNAECGYLTMVLC